MGCLALIQVYSHYFGRHQAMMPEIRGEHRNHLDKYSGSGASFWRSTRVKHLRAVILQHVAKIWRYVKEKFNQPESRDFF